MNDDHRQPGDSPVGATFRPGDRRPIPALRQRPRTTTNLYEISWRLQPRDYVLAHLLDEHRFLTTEQITAILYRSARTCRNRLNELRRIGFVTWFMPVHPRHGRLPVHWMAGPLSARY